MFFNKSYLLFILFIFSCFVSFSQVIPVYRDRSYDASYIAILNNAKSKGYRLPSAEQQKTQNELVLALKSAGVWDSLDVLYVFATDADANFAKLNWKNPAAHEGTYVGGVTFQKNGGIKGDGSTGYFNTNFNPATSGVRYTLNNAGRYFWVDNRDTVIFDGVETNSFNSSSNANTANIFINQGSTPSSIAVPFDVDGFHAINRTSSTAVELFTSSTQYSATATATAIESQTQLLFRSGSSYGASRMRIYAMGSALVSQNTEFLNALNTYITKVGWSGKRTSFLDTYTNAAAAYSLRALNSAYTGALIRIRRSTDNREMDIYANQFGDLDTDEIRNFVGMANGFVVTWYDQSGNNRHATQSNAANQPQLVTNGSIYIENRRVAIPHTAGNQQLNLGTDLNLGTTYSFFAVAAFSTTGKSLIGGSTSTSYAINVGASSITHAASTATGTAASTYGLTYSLFSQFRNGTTTVNTARNKTDLLPLTLSANSNFIFNSIQGERNTSTSFTGSVCEVIIYANDRTSSAVSMRFDINKYFKIYDESVPTPNLLLDDYPNAAAAYSLRLLRAAYTGDCIVVRRASNNDTLAIGFSGNYLDTAALKTFCASTNCFVSRWFDQSGNGNNVVQTISAGQPQIIASGQLVRHANGTPALLYDGTNDVLQGTVTQIVSSSGASLFYVYSTNAAAAQNTNTAALWAFLQSSASTAGIIRYHASSTGVVANETMFLEARTVAGGSQRLFSSTYTRAANTLVYESNIYASTGTTFFQDGNSVPLSGVNGVTASTDLRPSTINWQSWLDLGAASFGVYANQRISEFIVYASDQTTNRTGIETNIDSFY